VGAVKAGRIGSAGGRDTIVFVRPVPGGGSDSVGGAQLGVFAARDIAGGERIDDFEGTETASRTRMSLQVGPNRHVEPGEHHPLRYLNHACDPSASFISRELFARVDIPAETEITIDYNCHESELASPFACLCGAASCVGIVKGWNHLTEAQKNMRRHRAGAWLHESGTPTAPSPGLD
jgi:hypothetical protein